VLKKCCNCKLELPLLAFNKNKSSSYGVSCLCIKCRKEYDLNWRRRNKNSKAAASKRWRLKYPEKDKAVGRNYRQNNKAAGAAKTMRYFTKKLQRTPKWLTPLHFEQIHIFYDAAARLTKEFGVKMEVDHIIPLQGEYVSGLHVPWNLQILPKLDNASKRNICRHN
jgi:hypothetical protein